jgi:hypothetical protein
MYKDPIVQEIHAIRQQIWQEAGGTFEGVRKHAEQSRARLARIPTQEAVLKSAFDFEILPPGVKWDKKMSSAALV